jgi:hypothetical protein
MSLDGQENLIPAAQMKRKIKGFVPKQICLETILNRLKNQSLGYVDQ